MPTISSLERPLAVEHRRIRESGVSEVRRSDRRRAAGRRAPEAGPGCNRADGPPRRQPGGAARPRCVVRPVPRRSGPSSPAFRAANLDELGGELGLEFELEETESGVGAFSADIIAREQNRVVVIENQLDRQPPGPRARARRGWSHPQPQWSRRVDAPPGGRRGRALGRLARARAARGGGPRAAARRFRARRLRAARVRGGGPSGVLGRQSTAPPAGHPPSIRRRAPSQG